MALPSIQNKKDSLGESLLLNNWVLVFLKAMVTQKRLHILLIMPKHFSALYTYFKNRT